jgi:carbamate kinase
MAKTAVVALGGNAFTCEGQSGTYDEQMTNALVMARSVIDLLEDGWGVAVVHGNGPQVGNLAIQQQGGLDVVPAQPLHGLGSMTQGQLGSIVSLALRSYESKALRSVTALVTHVVVDAADPAFSNPTKPIGPFFTPETAQELSRQQGWVVAEDSGRGYRRVVASPRPQEIVESDAIKDLLGPGRVVIAAGGGGVPVTRGAGGRLDGVEAVIDKDFSAQRLAAQLGAQVLVLATGVPAVLIDFGTPEQRPLLTADIVEMQRHLEDGQFPPGSMGPKVRAAIDFVLGGGDVAVITTPELVSATLLPVEGQRCGTRVVANASVGAVR